MRGAALVKTVAVAASAGPVSIDKGVRGAGSVIGTAIQIAFFLGFREVYLIGCDLGYKVVDTVKQEGDDLFGNGVKIHLTSTDDDDANHFDPRYFGKGRRWHDPNVKRMISGHEQCRAGVAAGGGKIFNATIGGELEVYPRVAFDSLFPRDTSAQARERVNALINNVFVIAPVCSSRGSLMGPFLRCESAHLDETDAVAQLIGDGEPAFMIDVGAHRGTSCLPFLSKGWDVLAFEPDADNRAALVKSIQRHNLEKQIVIDTRAVGCETKSRVPYYHSATSSGISGLSAFHATHEQAGTVDVVTLGEVLQGVHHQRAVQFLKIDTEGHDLFVLQGFPWNGAPPAIIECEFEDVKTVPLGYTFHHLAGFLVAKGYRVYVSEWHPIIRYGIKHDWRRLARYPCELADPMGWGNLVAFRDAVDEGDLIAAFGKVLKLASVNPEKPKAAPSGTPKEVARSAKPAELVAATGAVYRVVPGPYFTQVAGNQWRYRAMEAGRRTWKAVFERIAPRPGGGYVGTISLRADRKITVGVILARHGGADFEGSSCPVTLMPGVAQTVELRKEFTNGHVGLRMEVEVLELSGGDTAVLTIDAILVSETLTSIRHRLGDEDISVRTANGLFRDGDYGAALGLYLLMYQMRPLKMYPDNALLAAGKLGLHWAQTADELVKRLS